MIPRRGGILPKEGIGEPVGGGFVSIWRTPPLVAQISQTTAPAAQPMAVTQRLPPAGISGSDHFAAKPHSQKLTAPKALTQSRTHAIFNL